MRKDQQSINYKLPNNHGFTLIEILVVFTIISILTGIGVATFASYSRAQQLNQTAINIKLLINEARFNALSVVKSATNESGSTISCGALSLVGYSITVIGSNELKLTQICEEVNGPDRTIKTITLPKAVTLISASPVADCTDIQFGSLSAVATGVPCALKLSGYDLPKTISVDVNGNTKVE